jgi:hypothetical protein
MSAACDFYVGFLLIFYLSRSKKAIVNSVGNRGVRYLQKYENQSVKNNASHKKLFANLLYSRINLKLFLRHA